MFLQLYLSVLFLNKAIEVQTKIQTKIQTIFPMTQCYSRDYFCIGIKDDQVSHSFEQKGCFKKQSCQVMLFANKMTSQHDIEWSIGLPISWFIVKATFSLLKEKSRSQGDESQVIGFHVYSFNGIMNVNESFGFFRKISSSMVITEKNKGFTYSGFSDSNEEKNHHIIAHFTSLDNIQYPNNTGRINLMTERIFAALKLEVKKNSSQSVTTTKEYKTPYSYLLFNDKNKQEKELRLEEEKADQGLMVVLLVCLVVTVIIVVGICVGVFHDKTKQLAVEASIKGLIKSTSTDIENLNEAKKR